MAPLPSRSVPDSFMPVDDLHPWMPALAENPYPWYADLREHDPVHYSPSLDAWFVTRYDDVVRVLRSPEEFSSSAILAPMGPLRGRPADRRGFIGARPGSVALPDHRRSARPHPAPAHGEPALHTVGDRRARAIHVRAITELVDDLIAASARGEADLIGQLGEPAPAPRDRGHARRRRRPRSRVPRMVERDDPRRARRARPRDATGHDARDDRLPRRDDRGAPGENPRDDLISMLVTGAEPLDAQELLDVHRGAPHRRERDDHQPDRERDARALGPPRPALRGSSTSRRSCPSFVEEVLRYDPPVQALSRRTTRDGRRRRCHHPRRTNVCTCSTASANRDASTSPTPIVPTSTVIRATTSRSAAASTSASAPRWPASRRRVGDGDAARHGSGRSGRRARSSASPLPRTRALRCSGASRASR